jgi:glycerol-1-phosphate dehydrogenase [NAD(P)+]
LARAEGDIVVKKIDGLINREILCECGRTHFVPVKEIRSWDDSIPPEAFRSFRSALMLCDARTKECANDRVAESLMRGGCRLKVREFTRERLVNDETAVGAAVLDADSSVDGIIAVGGGTVTDLGRFVASRVGKPYILVMTCPSMDGYASNIAAVSLDGKRKIFKDCCYPEAVFCDMRVMRGAPMELIRAGFGDMLGKRTSLPDWVISRHVTGERFCGRVASIMDDSSMACVRGVDGIASREPEAINTLTEALILGGISMAMADDTRPVSGSEHIFSHFMVESAMDSGPRVSHGESVAFGTLISALLYEYLLDGLRPADLDSISAELRKYLLPSRRVRDLLAASGISMRARDYLYRADVADMVRACSSPEKRYTVLRYLADSGHLDDGIRHVAGSLGEIAG